jgi:hypothetical protein
VRYAKYALFAFAYFLLTATNAVAGDGCWACPLSSSSKLSTSSKQVTPMNVASTSTSKSPSLVTRMSDSTKRFASGTKNLFAPKKSTSRGVKSVQASKVAKDEKPGAFKSMFTPDPPPPPKTIKEWMSLKQVHP